MKNNYIGSYWEACREDKHCFQMYMTPTGMGLDLEKNNKCNCGKTTWEQEVVKTATKMTKLFIEPEKG